MEAWENFLMAQVGASGVLIGLVFVGLSGLYWLVPAILISMIKAAVDAWVLLVEINR